MAVDPRAQPAIAVSDSDPRAQSAIAVSDSDQCTPSAITVPDAIAPPPGNPRFPLIDGMRAIAALSVLVFHTAFMSGASIGPALPSRLLAQLNIGVAVFFVISGFLMYRPLLAARAGAGPEVRLRDYARRRVLRIVPAYWVALTLLALWPGLPDMFSGRWWVYYGFMQDYGGVTAIDGIGSAWTLGCEVIFYAVLPFLSIALGRVALARCGRRVWWQFELAALAGLCVASGLYRALVNGRSTALPGNSFPGTFAWFVFGMLLALWSVSARGSSLVGRVDEKRTTYIRFASSIPLAAICWSLAALLYLVLSFGLTYTNGNPFLERDSGLHVVVWYALDGLIAVCLVAPAVFAAGQRSAVARLLAWRPLAWIGLISYGIYLYHNPLLSWISGGHVGGDHRFLRLIWLTGATFAAAVLAAAISYYVVERPFLRLKERPRWLRASALVSRSST